MKKRVLQCMLSAVVSASVLMVLVSEEVVFAEEFLSEQMVMTENDFSDEMETEIFPETFASVSAEETVAERESIVLEELVPEEESDPIELVEEPEESIEQSAEIEFPIIEEEITGDSEETAEFPIATEEPMEELEESAEITTTEIVETGNYAANPTSGSFGQKGGTLKWVFAGGVLTISGNGEMEDFIYYSPCPWNSFRERIKTVVIQKGVTNIGDEAFNQCSSLTSVTIPEGVMRIGRSAFEQCSSLVSVTIPEGVTSIGNSAFELCTSLKDITISEGLTSVGDGAFEWCTSLESFVFPKGVKNIGSWAFGSCSSLTNVMIPEGVTSIGDNAFHSCSSLTKVMISKGITSIGFSVFEDCSSLTSITIPKGVTSIKSSAFRGCSSLIKVTIPSGVKDIGWSVFNGCSSLTEITLPEGMTSIGGYAFEDCSSLTSVLIPEGMLCIQVDAFLGCSSLTSVVVPSSVTDIGIYAFGYSYYNGNKKIPGFTIIGAKGSAAEKYARDNGFTFQELGSAEKPATPKLKSVVNTFSGIQFKWNSVPGAVKYRVYFRVGNSSWNLIGDTAVSSYIRQSKDLMAGLKYTFTVRAVNKNGQTSGFDKNGLAVTYVKPSSVSKLENTVNGVKITWKKSSGAAQYVLYYTGTGSWKKLCRTTKTSYTWKGAKSGKKYKFMVKALAKDGSTAYHDNGRSITYIAAPSGIRAVKFGSTGVKITWKKSAGAEKYRVFCRIGTGSWVVLGDTTKTSYTWKKGIKGIKYTFTVRCISKNGKTFTSAFDSKGVNLKL